MTAQNKIGRRTFRPGEHVCISAWASVAGKKESEGPLGHLYDLTSSDTKFSEKSWEQAEKKMQQLALNTLLDKAGITPADVDLVYSGDLLNQCIGSSFSLRNTGIAHLGLYGACSTMAESLLLSAITAGGGYADRVVAMTSSHFASSERQYRFPLGYGGQRTPTAQWTVTGSGAALVERRSGTVEITAATVGTVTDLGITDPANMGCAMAPAAFDTIRTHFDEVERRSGTVEITAATVGTVTDLGITDPANMGCAMAPAAFDTIRTHFDDTHTGPEDFDLIVTGDLGSLGKEALMYLFRKEGISIGGKLTDCGTMVFDAQKQDVHCGGSGCGCSAIVLCSELLSKLQAGKLKKILFCGTGALLSPTSTQQNLPIPGVCHGVCIQSRR